MKTLPIEQMDSFLREARDSGVFEMYYVELATGFRRGQLLGLKWEDIDFEHDNLQVKRQIARINDEIVKAHRKSKALASTERWWHRSRRKTPTKRCRRRRIPSRF